MMIVPNARTTSTKTRKQRILISPCHTDTRPQSRKCEPHHTAASRSRVRLEAQLIHPFCLKKADWSKSGTMPSKRPALPVCPSLLTPGSSIPSRLHEREEDAPATCSSFCSAVRLAPDLYRICVPRAVTFKPCIVLDASSSLRGCLRMEDTRSTLPTPPSCLRGGSGLAVVLLVLLVLPLRAPPF